MPKQKQTVSQLVGGMGVATSLITSLVKAVQKRGGKDEDIHRLVTPEGEQILGTIADLMVEAGKAKPTRTVVATFTIVCEGSWETSELVGQGKYDWFNDWITDERFPIQKHAPLDRTIELVEFDHDPSDDEVLEELRSRGLERPTYEDALYFGIRHPEEQRKHPVVFLHEPVLDPRGYRLVLVLSEFAGERDLHLFLFDDGWNRDCVFAGVRKSVA